MNITKAQLLARNIRLRIAMLETYGAGWSIRLAREIADMRSGRWSQYRCGTAQYVTDEAVARIAAGLGMRPVDLLSSPGRVIATSIPDAWLALPAVREESPQPGEDDPHASGAVG